MLGYGEDFSNKSNISELLNVVNFNVAALGVALIAHDLSQPATKTYNWSKLDVNQLAWEKENVVAEDSEVVEVLVNADIPKEIEAYKNSNKDVYAQLEVGVFGENENKNSFEEKSADMGLIENVSVNFLQSEATVDNAHLTGNYYDITWGDGKLTLVADVSAVNKANEQEAVLVNQ